MSRSWYRSYFVDHPLYQKGNPQNRPDSVWANQHKDKIKIICKKCLDSHIGMAIQEDEQKAAQDSTFLPRSHNDIKLSFFNTSANDPNRLWIEARSDTSLTHLLHCPLVSPEIRSIAQARSRTGNNTINPDTTPRAQRIASNTNIVSPRPVYPIPAAPNFIMQWHLEQAQGTSNTLNLRPPSVQFNQHRNSPFPSDPFIQESSHTGLFPFPSNASPDSASVYSAGSAYTSSSSHVSKYARRSSTALKRSSSVLSDPGTAASWNIDKQKQFEVSLARLTASANLPFNWVTNPEFIRFCQEFLPSAKVPSRRVLSNRILPNLLTNIRASIRQKVMGQTITIQCDGWTALNHTHLVAFMLSTHDEIHTITVKDTTTERKTAAKLLAHMLEVINLLENEWKVTVAAFTTDASGESRKARRLLSLERPELVTPDCYAHQINLIVGDYFKSNGTQFLRYSAEANELIAWLRSKTQILGKIKEVMILKGRKPLSVIRPVPTRWTAYYLAYRRLLDLRTALELIAFEDAILQPNDRLIIQPSLDRLARQKAERMVELIKNSIFWISIARIKHHLAPLAIAANITQSSHCRLDEVALTFATLFIEYQKLNDLIDIEVREALLGSIERRWEKCDQDVFVAAIILNPFIKLTPFNYDEDIISQGAIYQLLARLWARFFKSQCPDTFYEEIRQYLHNTSKYAILEQTVNRLQNTAASQNKSPNPVQVYQDITIPGKEPSPLIKLALHILSICPNSASCERLFSTFGLILTKLRASLGLQKVVDLAECKLHLRNEFLETNNKTNIRRRLFGVHGGSESHSQPGDVPSQTISNISSSSSSYQPEHGHEPELDSTMEVQTQSGRSQSNLTQLTSRLINMVDEDNDPEDIPEDLGTPKKRLITEWFNLSQNAAWIPHAQRSAVGSLEDELELYDLLDLDAHGEVDDVDYDVEDSVDSILTS